KKLQQRLILILGLAFVLVAALLALRIRQVTRPVEELTAAAKAMTDGDLDYPIPVGARDEIGVLSRSLDTMRRRLREKIHQLAASERNYRELVQGANSIVLRWDKEGRVLFMNDYGLKLFGYTAEELVGRHVVGTIVPDRATNGADLARMIDDILLHPEAYQLNENENCTKNGRRLIIQWTNRAITDEDGTVEELLSVGTDVTEQRRLEAELRQAQKLEAIGTLAGGIAHDFNNILTAIFGFTELAQMEAGDNPTLRHLLDQQLTAARRARDLVRQILAFSRRSEQEKAPIQISLLVKETLKLLRASLPATIEIQADITSTATILADPTQIHQMLMNLATNAFHAMEEQGGRLTITLDETDLDHEEAKTFAPHLPPGRYLRLAVSDTGGGIEQEILDKIFEPYFTTKEAGKGTGLGLAVVHGIVRGHGGSIRVRSTPGAGTTFTVLLPIASSEETRAHPTAAGASPHAAAPARARIMVVDDEESVRFLLQEFLARAGHRPTSFASPKTALEAFRRSPAAWDMVITDLTMPGGTGLDLASQLRATRQDIPIILCTGQSERVDAERLAALAIDASLRKPLLQRELVRVVSRVLAERRQTSCNP
ncbi:MAG TPA: response regulator, partial [Desulfobacterales bacterium]|nr:response regulator [Desulfobacterales bacterium]